MIKLTGATCAAIDDLRAQVHFCADSGQIWLHEHRMLLVHVEAQATLRQELIESLGMERAQGLLTRLGYAAGLHDAELARTRSGDCSELEAFMTGPQLHTLEGGVRATPLGLAFDRASGAFHGEFLWENSWEGQAHRRHFGVHGEPVCWSQIGYASGYTSAFMGRRILYKEIECIGMGHAHCRIIGKPAEEWADGARQLRFFTPASLQALPEPAPVSLRTYSTSPTGVPEAEALPGDLVGSSPGFRAACQMLRLAATSQVAVLLLGETGVGKEMFARALHQLGTRREQPFIAVNCAAIPHELVESELFGVEKGAYTGALASRPGRFERADGGTLFLDEIADLPLAAQSKLLRVLQDGEFERLGDLKPRQANVRLVAAANRDLRKCVREGTFRADLYYRLNVFQIEIPPLRERKQDISALARRFLERCSLRHGKKLRGFTDKAKRALLGDNWPGNIRELQNTVERAVILAPEGTRIEVHHLFPGCAAERDHAFGLNPHGDLAVCSVNNERTLCDAVLNGAMTLDQVEDMLIEAAVDKARGNLSSAARLLGLTRPQLAYRLKRLHGGDADKDEAALRSRPMSLDLG